jgi:hypothetical protein
MKNTTSTNRIRNALKWLNAVDLGKLSKFQIGRVLMAIRELEAALTEGAQYRK